MTRLALAMSFAAVVTVAAETIDRVAVSVGNRVITTSEIDLQIRVSAFLSGTKPDLSAPSRRKAAEALVDQKLIQGELETARYPEPAPAELDEMFAAFKKKYYPTDEAYRRALAEYGITDGDVRAQLHWQRRWASFIGVRFQPAIGVSEGDIQQYFEKTVAPAARAAHPGQDVKLEDYRDQIFNTLMGRREDEQMEQWLSDARNRAEIVWHQEAFE